VGTGLALIRGVGEVTPPATQTAVPGPVPAPRRVGHLAARWRPHRAGIA
jgi:hypothetical protein